MKIAIAIILHPESDAVLVTKRKTGTHVGGQWEFPGGKVEIGESDEDCVKREVIEETGLEVTILGRLPELTYDYVDRTVELVPFLCRSFSADFHCLASEAGAWAPLCALDDYDFPSANVELVAGLRNLFGH